MQGRSSVAGHLYETYYPGVFATCLALLGSREDAADATHEVFARALPLADTLAHPNAWLQTAARHHCTDLLRRRQLAARDATAEWAAGRPEPDPADVVELRHTAAQAWASLNDREQRALAQHVFRGASVPEVAARMRLSYAAAVQLLSRARRRAAQVGQLPSALAAPPRLIASMARRLTGPAVTGSSMAGGRGMAAGAAVLCATSVLCTGGVSRSAPTRTAPRVARVAGAVAPHRAPTALPARVGVALPVRPRLAKAFPLLRHPLPLPAPPTCTPDAATESSPVVVWTDAAGDERSVPRGVEGPQSDLIRATVATRGDMLIVRIYVRDMSLTMPEGVTNMEWSLGWGGNEVDAMVDGHRLMFWDRAVGADGADPDTGNIVPGAGGDVEIQVPFEHLHLRHGETLPNLQGVATTWSTLDLYTADIAGTGTYTIPPATCA